MKQEQDAMLNNQKIRKSSCKVHDHKNFKFNRKSTQQPNFLASRTENQNNGD